MPYARWIGTAAVIAVSSALVAHRIRSHVSPRFSDLREVPQYRVHAYHDTGEKVTIGGARRPVLTRQTAYGYFVSHTGAFRGWRHSLSSPPEPTARSEYIAPDVEPPTPDPSEAPLASAVVRDPKRPKTDP
jgi:hypothetical protein